ncbi:MAG TPA: dual specificity protein phosphatase [Thermoplasmata archaeon]
MKRSAPKPRPRTPAGKPKASEIAPGVFVGGWSDAVAFRGTRLCVLDEVPDEPIPAEAHLPIYDEKKDEPIRVNLDRVAQLVEKARAKKEPVLLFCGHGVRRGPLAGAWYLHRHEGIPLDDAYDRVRAVRPKVEHVKDWVGGWKLLAEE